MRCVLLCLSEGLVALWEDYVDGSKERKRLLQSRYGHSVLNVTLARFLSESWVKVNTKCCPYCFSKIEVFIFRPVGATGENLSHPVMRIFSCVIVICCVFFCRSTADVTWWLVVAVVAPSVGPASPNWYIMEMITLLTVPALSTGNLPTTSGIYLQPLLKHRIESTLCLKCTQKFIFQHLIS